MIHFAWFLPGASLREAALTLTLALAATGCASDAPEPASDPFDDEPTAPSARAQAIDASTPADAELASDAGAARAPGATRIIDAGAGLRTPAASAPDAAGASFDAELEALRQHCVDEINRYRATLGIAPLARASDREACSDKGAQLDGDSMRAHGSATAGGRQGKDGYCPSGAQNTCPGWAVGGRSGNATVRAALDGCLKMMWNEGAPPAGSCTGACYQAHGHYLNMSAAGSKRVACGFYKMRNGSYWMNQNFW